MANRATQHLYIVNPIKSFEERSKSLWDTHPPIGERIRALERHRRPDRVGRPAALGPARLRPRGGIGILATA